MNAEWLLGTLYEVEEVIEDNKECFSFIEKNEETPTVFKRLTSIEKQIPHRSYVFGKVPNMKYGIEVFFYKGTEWKYLRLIYRKEEEEIAFYRGTISEEGLENLNLSITGEFKPLSDLIYDYFVQHPTYRLKEVTGVITRR